MYKKKKISCDPYPSYSLCGQYSLPIYLPVRYKLILASGIYFTIEQIVICPHQFILMLTGKKFKGFDST